MLIAGRLALQEAVVKHADAANAVALWVKIVARAQWRNFVQLKADLPSADYVAPYTVFNIKGNRYRLIALVEYAEQVLVVRNFLTHAAYGKGRWK